MIRTIPLAAVLALAACSPQQQATATKLAQTPAGALFCSLELAGGGAMVVNIVDTAGTAAVTATAPAAAPVAGVVLALATNAAKQDVDKTCADAAKSVTGATAGVPVSPPLNAASVPVVAVPLPAGLPTVRVEVGS